MWILVGVFAGAMPEVAGATTVTEYEYNGDGALVRVTRTEAGSESEETYLVWDNFLPGAGDPTQGTLAAGNGNLLGTGPSPTSLESTYGYDLRNRLVEQEGPGPGVTYGYDAASLLSTATSGSETYRFVYDESANARVTNIEAETADVVLRRMGPVCSLTDGTERMLVRPDKDVAGVYDRSAETFTAYEYDPYGGTEESGGTKLDLHENPFQYAGEYRDPIWGGYYLRARWYAPDLPTFLSRDPAPNLSRYGYGDGNPRNRVDPSGRSSKWWKRWNKGGAKFMHEVTGGGARGVVERVFAGGILMPMGIVANPKAFWQSVARGSAATTVVNDAVLAVGMVGEVVMDGPMSGSSGYRADFLRRIAFDAAFGLAQSASSASSHGFRRFNEKAFFQGLEFAAGGVLDTRIVVGRGYAPYRTAEEVRPHVGRIYQLGEYSKLLNHPLGSFLTRDTPFYVRVQSDGNFEFFDPHDSLSYERDIRVTSRRLRGLSAAGEEDAVGGVLERWANERYARLFGRQYAARTPALSSTESVAPSVEPAAPEVPELPEGDVAFFRSHRGPVESKWELRRLTD